MNRSTRRSPTWMLTLFFASGLGLVLVPSCRHVPLLASSVCALMGAFLLVTAVASVAGPAASRQAARIARDLLRRRLG
ncbi:MAG TPA: hypothetical protein VN253_25465 [Kofleriaceae bacterium]|nr:hypothetical protein [Kofleriaceae bacterium]